MTDAARQSARPPTRALILAAGMGNRLGDSAEHKPKCLLRFDGISLIQRHFRILEQHGITEIAIVIGYQADFLRQQIEAIDSPVIRRFVVNPDYAEGSVVSLWCLRDELEAGADVLLMDADVLYHPAMIERLTTTRLANAFLLDSDFEDGEEPVKLCVDNSGRLVEFRKQVAADLDYEMAGESVGFFRLSAAMAARLARCCADYVDGGRRDQPYEEALRDLLLDSPEEFGFEDVSGIAWIEIDFPEDVIRARDEILPATLK